MLNSRLIPPKVSAGAAFLGPVLTPIAGDALLLNEAIEALRAASLIRRDPKAQMLSLHRLVQAVLQDQQDPAERRTWAEQVVRAVNAASPLVTYEDDAMWDQCERLLPLALSAAEHIEHHQMRFEEAGQLLSKTASYLSHRRRHKEAEPLYQRAVHIYEQSLGPENPSVADSLTGLGILYEQQVGPEQPDLAHPLTCMALLFYEQSRYAEAEPLLQRALAIYEQQVGPEHPNMAGPLTVLAALYTEWGQYAEAEPLYQRALRIREQYLSPEHPDTAEILHDLATLREQQGNCQEALALSQRAFAIRERALGETHPKTCATRSLKAVSRSRVGQETGIPPEDGISLKHYGQQGQDVVNQEMLER